ncbi:hypothetical protein RVBP16_1340 [Pseudomonas phage sp. 30-2]|nr:hypothetical protein RVBP16_1340 [Pseudomonas phage sp. 30-2]
MQINETKKYRHKYYVSQFIIFAISRDVLNIKKNNHLLTNVISKCISIKYSYRTDIINYNLNI